MNFRILWIAAVCGLLVVSGCSSSSLDRASKSDGVAESQVSPRSSAANQIAKGSSPDAKMESVPSAGAGQVNPAQRKLIYTIELHLKVANLEEALKTVESAVSRAQGYMSRMERTSEEYASLELRIPAAVMGEAVNSLKSLGKVVNESKSGQDVTEEYIDVEARVRALKIEEERYLELVKKATKVEEILQVERELSRVRGEIERAQGRIQYLNNRIEYATIHLQLERAKTLDNESPKSAASRAWEGLVDDLTDLLNFGKEALIWLASNLFTLLLTIGGGYLVYKKLKPVVAKRMGGPKGPEA